MQREHQKTMVDLVSQTITLHLDDTLRSCFCLFFNVDYYMKFRNFTFEGRRRQTTTNVFFLFLNLESGSKNPTAGGSFFSGLEDIFVWPFYVTTRGH